MNPLLKYFIEASIGHKDFSVVERHIADEVFREDAEKQFVIEFPVDNPNMSYIWKRAVWQRKDELQKMMDENTKRMVDESIAKYNKALSYLTTEGNLSEEDARQMLTMPLIREKFGL